MIDGINNIIYNYLIITTHDNDNIKKNNDKDDTINDNKIMPVMIM